MNYQLIYNQLIQNRKLNPYEGYTEKHHIIPKSHGGNDSKENWVRLSAREHFIAHWLLWRIHRNSKMAYAFHSMTMKNSHTKDRYKNSKGFEEARKANSIAMSSTMKGKQYTLGYTHSIITRLNMSKGKTGHSLSVTTKNKISQSLKGKSKPQKLIVCPHCGKEGGNAIRQWHFDKCKTLILS